MRQHLQVSDQTEEEYNFSLYPYHPDLQEDGPLMISNMSNVLSQLLLFNSIYFPQVELDLIAVITNNALWIVLLYVLDDEINICYFVDHLLERM